MYFPADIQNAFVHLGIEPTSDLDTIQKAYRVKSLSTHPDVNGDINALEDFKNINESYSSIRKFLSDNPKYHKSNYYDKVSIPTDQQCDCSARVSHFCLGETLKFKYVVLDFCFACKGSQTFSVNSCDECLGLGYLIEMREESITIPQGLKPGESIVKSKAGNLYKPDHERGNLVIKINLDDPDFKYSPKVGKLSVHQDLTPSQMAGLEPCLIKTPYGEREYTIRDSYRFKYKSKTYITIEKSGLLNKNGYPQDLLLYPRFQIPNIYDIDINNIEYFQNIKEILDGR